MGVLGTSAAGHMLSFPSKADLFRISASELLFFGDALECLVGRLDPIEEVYAFARNEPHNLVSSRGGR
jgi:hypothetical protein